MVDLVALVAFGRLYLSLVAFDNHFGGLSATSSTAAPELW